MYCRFKSATCGTFSKPRTTRKMISLWICKSWTRVSFNHWLMSCKADGSPFRRGRITEGIFSEWIWHSDYEALLWCLRCTEEDGNISKDVCPQIQHPIITGKSMPPEYFEGTMITIFVHMAQVSDVLLKGSIEVTEGRSKR